jgi:hypothetical protein
MWTKGVALFRRLTKAEKHEGQPAAVKGRGYC